jgi:hypothetical protein
LTALQPQRRDSGMARGVMCIQDSQVSQRKQSRSVLNVATTGWMRAMQKYEATMKRKQLRKVIG